MEAARGRDRPKPAPSASSGAAPGPRRPEASRARSLVPILAMALAIAVALLSAGCAGERRADASPRAAARGALTTVAATTTTSPSGSRLVIADRAEAKLTDNFNPFAISSPLYQLGVPFYIYEPLVQYNDLGDDQYYPWLAGSWSFSSSGSTITFNLRTGVKWADGSNFTAADVAYTFNLLKNNPSIAYGLPIVSAIASNTTTFTLTLSQPGYAYLYDIARVPIVKNGYAGRSGLTTYVDKAPDGTGPYTLAGSGGFSPQRVVLTGRAGYWQSNQPAIHQLVFPAYPDNAAIASALQSGSLDWAGTELSDVVTDYVDKDKSVNHYWGPPVDCIALELNLARGPMATLRVRQAISDVIDRDALSQGMSGGLELPVSSASGLVLPTDSQFLVHADTGDIADGGDAAAAVPLMKAAGYHLGQHGYWTDATGHVVQFTIEDPVSTDLATGATLVASQLRAAGFDTSASLVTAARWRRDLTDGRFYASIMASTGGPSPFYMYQYWLDPALVVHGHAQGGNYEQLDAATAPKVAAAVNADLDTYTDSLSDSASAEASVRDLATLVAQELPVVPLVYGVAWGEFSTRHATGWPNGQDPYEPAIPKAPFAEYTVLQLSPSSP